MKGTKCDDNVGGEGSLTSHIVITFCSFHTLVYFALHSSCVLVFFMLFSYSCPSFLACWVMCLSRYLSPLPSYLSMFCSSSNYVFRVSHMICGDNTSPPFILFCKFKFGGGSSKVLKPLRHFFLFDIFLI